jgi:hypothetical protein
VELARELSYFLAAMMFRNVKFQFDFPAEVTEALFAWHVVWTCRLSINLSAVDIYKEMNEYAFKSGTMQKEASFVFAS